MSETRYILETQAPWWTPQGVKNMIGRLTGAWSISPAGKAQFSQLGEDWIDLSLTDDGTNKWEDYDATTHQKCQYRRAGDTIRLRGLAKRTLGTGNLIGILPTGYRPLKLEILPTSSISLYGEIWIDNLGGLYMQVGDPSWISLNPVEFSTL